MHFFVSHIYFIMKVFDYLAFSPPTSINYIIILIIYTLASTSLNPCL